MSVVNGASLEILVEIEGDEDFNDSEFDNYSETFLQNQRDQKMLEWWEKCGGKTEDFNMEISAYFQYCFEKHSDGKGIMHRFSVDGLGKIENIFKLGRKNSLDICRKIFDLYRHEKNLESTNQNKININSDEKSIIQYIGGYILRRLLKKCNLNHQNCIRDTLLKSTPSNLTPSSLIQVKENLNYGTLLTPCDSLLIFLIHVEEMFRAHYCKTKIIESIMSNIEYHNYSTICDVALLKKISAFYLKIRCFQKAKKLNSSNHLSFDQNISFRKSIK